MKARIGYELGWDFASHGLRAPDGACADVLAGHQEGALHFARKHKPVDMYVKKWLHLRYNALARARVFDDEVTPEFLRSIYQGTCPITRLKLTSGTMSESDWSIDRIINDGGYTRRNLMVMSTKANQAKGGKSLRDILSRCTLRQVDHSLSQLEWQRMASIVQSAYSNAGLITETQFVLMPMVEFGPNHIGERWDEVLQSVFLTYICIRRGEYTPPKDAVFPHVISVIKKSCQDIEARNMLHRLVSRLERRWGGTPYKMDLWWNPATFFLLRDLIAYQTKVARVWPHKLLNVLAGHSAACFGAASKAEFYQDMSIENGGYFPKQECRVISHG